MIPYPNRLKAYRWQDAGNRGLYPRCGVIVRRRKVARSSECVDIHRSHRNPTLASRDALGTPIPDIIERERVQGTQVIGNGLRRTYIRIAGLLSGRSIAIAEVDLPSVEVILVIQGKLVVRVIYLPVNVRIKQPGLQRGRVNLNLVGEGRVG